MRAGRRAGAADIADRGPLFHAVAAVEATCEARHVPVERRDSASVLEDHDASVAALGADEAHATITGRLDDRAGGRGVVHALVRADHVQERMLAPRVEVRAYAREVERCAQKLAPHAAAIRRE